MIRNSLQKRVEMLELRVNELMSRVAAAESPPAKDWRRTVGAFTDDPGMQEIMKQAMRLREQDRKRALK